MTKANGSANMERTWVPFDPDTHFVDGRRLTPWSGGVARTPDGGLWAIATPESVPHGHEPVPGPNGTINVLSRRAAEIIIAKSLPEALHTGCEFEIAAMHSDGHYATVVDDKGDYSKEFEAIGLDAPELYTIMTETSVEPSTTPEEAYDHLFNRMGELATAASNSNLLLAPVSVLGQEADYASLGNDHPYVAFIRQFMQERTGFDVAKIFRVLSVQFHREVVSTEFMMATGEAAQPLLPLWAAASFNGPFLHGGLKRVIGDHLTDKQRAHLSRQGFTLNDLQPGTASWRYVLRCIGSSSAGAWREDIPTDFEGTIDFAHKKLQAGEIPTIDRVVGMHSNLRPRFTLHGSRGTHEDCTPDTYAGNIQKIAAAQVFYGASMLALERMLMNGQDPRQAFPGLYTDRRGQEERNANHRRNLVVSRGGMDAWVRGKQVHDHFDDLERLALMGGCDTATIGEMRKSYTSQAKTEAVIRSWMKENREDLPSMRAYHETGVGAPYMYLIARAEALREKQPHLTEDEVIRNCELDMAVTFMRQWD